MGKSLYRLAVGPLLFGASASALGQPSVSTFQYDARGRVTEVEAATGGKSGYSHDASGNRTNVTIRRRLDTVWQAEAMAHSTGYAEYAGWAANIGNAQGFLNGGPYVNTVPVGDHVAVFKLMIGSNASPSLDGVVVLDVWDINAGEVIATRTLIATSFATSMAYQIFELPFTYSSARAGHQLEFRTYFLAKVYINVDLVGYY